MKKLQIKIGTIIISAVPLFTIISCSSNNESVKNDKIWHFGDFNSKMGESKEDFIDRLIKNNITKSSFTNLKSSNSSNEKWLSFRKKDYEKLNKIYSNYSWKNKEQESLKEATNVYDYPLRFAGDRTNNGDIIFGYDDESEKSSKNFLFALNYNDVGKEEIQLSYKDSDQNIEKKYSHSIFENEDKLNVEDLKKSLKILDFEQVGSYGSEFQESKVKITSNKPGISIKLKNDFNNSASYKNNVLKNGANWKNYNSKFEVKVKGNKANKKIKIIKLLENNTIGFKTPELRLTMDENAKLSWEHVMDNDYYNSVLQREKGIKFWTDSGDLISNIGSKQEDGSIYISYDDTSVGYTWEQVLKSELADLRKQNNNNGSYIVEHKTIKNAKRYEARWFPFDSSRFYLNIIGDKEGNPIIENDIDVSWLSSGSNKEKAYPLKTNFKVSITIWSGRFKHIKTWKFQINGWKNQQQIKNNLKIKINENKEMITHSKNELITFKGNVNVDLFDSKGGYSFNNLLNHYFVRSHDNFEMKSYSRNWWNNIEDAKQYIRDRVHHR